MVVCRAYVILGVGQQLQHQDFQRRVEAKQTAFFFGGGGDLVCTSHYTMQKIMDFNDLLFFFIKMKQFKEKFKNFRVWELGNTDRKLLTTQNFWPFQASC